MYGKLYGYKIPFNEIIKLKEQLSGRRKIYTIDSGLINSISFQFSQNMGRLMENIVFTQLKRLELEFYFYYSQSKEEVDFIIKDNLKIKELIQVCFNLDNIVTREREINSLLRVSRYLKCDNLKIITSDTEKTDQIKGKEIKLVPLWKWLLQCYLILI